MTFLANSNLILQIYHAKIDSNGRQKAIPKGVDETHQSIYKKVSAITLLKLLIAHIFLNGIGFRHNDSITKKCIR